jgi:anti-sigma B factor antagonist
MTDLLARPGICSGHRCLSPVGDLDLATAPQLRQEFVEAASGDSSLVVLDLGGVPFLDSVGISVIVGGHKRLRHEGRWLHIANAGATVRRVLDLTRLGSIIPTYDTVADAVAGCPTPHAAY